MHYNCLIVDDERMLADNTAKYLNLFDVSCAAVYGARECEEFFLGNTADLLLLDVNLSDGDGLQLCKRLRPVHTLPILFISARTAENDQIAALSVGGDDYISKPYSLPLLLAKVKAALKRCGRTEKEAWTDGRLKVDFAQKAVSVDGRPVRLTGMEYKLLCYLVKNAGRTINKAELFENVWRDKFTGDGTLNVHVRKLREAVEKDPDKPKYIVTDWGNGYIFEGKEK